MMPFLASITAFALVTLPSLASGPGPYVTRPVVPTDVSPPERVVPVSEDGYLGTAILRKPPGDGPYPAVVFVHGGLATESLEYLRDYALSEPLPSRFLAAGYVIAAITYRSRANDPQSRVSLDDVAAAVEYVEDRPYVDDKSVAVYGCSGGGDLAISLASEKTVAAIVAEEPASIMFTGVWNSSWPKAGDRYSGRNAAPILEDPRRYYTAEYQRLTREKIEGIHTPILIIQGDAEALLDVNKFNAMVLIPELRAAGKFVEVITYSGEPHCFAMESRGSPEAGLEAFRDTDAFVRNHIDIEPRPVPATLIKSAPVRTKE